MALTRSLSAVLLACVSIFSTAALAEVPFTFHGLHANLPFAAAVARAETLGGVCTVIAARRSAQGKKAQCEYLSCAQAAEPDSCEMRDKDSTVLSLGSQPIVSIGLEAAGTDAPVSRVVIAYAGSTSAVEMSLRKQFGEPLRNESAEEVKSWSNSKRLHWQRGGYRMGLLHPSRLLMLTVDPQPQNVDVDDS